MRMREDAQLFDLTPDVGFMIYEMIVMNSGFRLHFSKIEVGLSNFHQLSSSQIRLVSWGFILKLHMLCIHMGVPSSISCFCYLFWPLTRVNSCHKWVLFTHV